MKNRQVLLIVLFGVFLGVIAGLIIAANWNLPKGSVAAEDRVFSTSRTDDLSSDPSVASLQTMSKGFAAVAKKVKPSVVTIKSTATVRTDVPEFWRQFFNVPEEQIRQGLGSGVIVDENGYILTNNHVVENADELQVTIGTSAYDAKIIGRDPQSDLAVIKIDAKNLTPIKMGDSDELEVGEWVLAIGNPFSELLDQTVTAGIVSAKGRSGLTRGEISFEDFIQTDAAINPGNSGGALVNLKGELVGINTMIFSTSGGNVGIGFAIPINLAKNVMKQLIEKGRVTRGWLGVYIGNVSEETAEAFGLDKPRGALVNQVTENSPAEEAGLRNGDVILKVNDKEIRDSSMLMNTIAAMAPGTRVTLTIWRDGKEKTVSVKLGERPDTFAEDTQKGTKGNTLGLEVANLTAETQRRLGTNYDEEGVLVVRVVNNSPADRQGIRVGDLIKEVNRRQVTNVRQFNSVINEVKPGEVVLFRIKRGNNSMFVAVRAPREKK
ncbi:MAG: DegQ family serine endoprotease [candidate division KSB1 bacterium]|nr:DegQ family serine endoprotease [candidate division KSB1 bacterium]MDZ7345587.1 DegQ family serine endoprotease [candidate division KSB1 bacterium]